MEWQAQEFQERSGITCETHLLAEEIALDSDRATAVFRIFQETLTNVARHADASKVVVDLRREGESLILAVRDNGKGIDEATINTSGSLGLARHPRASDRLWRKHGTYRVARARHLRDCADSDRITRESLADENSYRR